VGGVKVSGADADGSVTILSITYLSIIEIVCCNLNQIQSSINTKYQRSTKADKI